MVKVTFTLDEETVERLRGMAARLGRPQSQVVREAVKDYDARSGRLSDAERQAMLEAFDRLVLTIPRRPPEEVAAELRVIRESRRHWGRQRRRSEK